MKAITVLNQKGGCGKTSLSVLLSIALASTGKKVLAVDCDPQGGLTSFLDPSEDDTRPGMFEIISSGQKKIPDVVVHVDRRGIEVDLIPADFRLDNVAPTMDPFNLKRLFKAIKGYDYLIFDCPPTVQGISRAAAIVADKIYIPADIAAPTLGPTLYTLSSLTDLEKAGEVILIGYKEPKKENKGYMAELSRKFIEKLNGHYVGTVPKTITTARAIADPTSNWTQTKFDKILKPLIEIVERS